MNGSLALFKFSCILGMKTELPVHDPLRMIPSMSDGSNCSILRRVPLHRPREGEMFLRMIIGIPTFNLR